MLKLTARAISLRISLAAILLAVALIPGWAASTAHGAQPGISITGATKAQATVATATPSPNPQSKVIVNGRMYDAYLPAATKSKQAYQYSCEFDAAWVILKTHGFDVSIERQAEIVGISRGREPYYKE